MRVFSYVLVGLVLCFGLSGCKDEADKTPDKISVIGKAHKFGRLSSPLSETLRVQVFGKRIPGFLGGKGSTNPIEGVEVKFTLSDEAKVAGAKLSTETVVTDAGGMAEVVFTTGNIPGDEMVKVEILHDELHAVKPVVFTVAAGMEVLLSSPDGDAGANLDAPLIVELEAAAGVPMVGAVVEFALINGPKKSKVCKSKLITDEKGRVEVEIFAGKASGKGQVSVAVYGTNAPKPFVFRPIRVSFFSIDKFGIGIKVLGGLAIFILGMTMMSEGLTLMAGDKLRAILGWFTSNKYSGILVGTAVTGLIQSSSACSVMVIGFVNAGLIQLEQAISVIIGANIGTTVTAQMISFKLSNLALPAIMIGVLMSLTAKKQSIKFYAQVIMGFGMLFYGLSIMSGPLKSLKDSHALITVFASIDCTPTDGSIPLAAAFAALALGAGVTMLVQSSSASIGLLLALTSSGFLNIWTGFPIILGANIGTTVTAVLAAIGANRVAKRTACAHALFNVIGALVMMGLLFWDTDSDPLVVRPAFLVLVDYVTNGDIFANENITRSIANAHTLFNIMAAIVILPFVGSIARLCCRIIPADESVPVQNVELEPHLLATPSLAFDQVFQEITIMAKMAHTSVLNSFEHFMGDITKMPTEEELARYAKLEDEIDLIQKTTTDYIAEISQSAITEEQSPLVPQLIRAVNDLERIGDHGDNIITETRRLRQHGVALSKGEKEKLQSLFSHVEVMFCDVVRALEDNDDQAADRALHEEDRVNQVYNHLRRSQVRYLETEGGDLRVGIIFLEMLANLEKIADHLENIAEGHKICSQWRHSADAGIPVPFSPEAPEENVSE